MTATIAPASGADLITEVARRVRAGRSLDDAIADATRHDSIERQDNLIADLAIALHLPPLDAYDVDQLPNPHGRDRDERADRPGAYLCRLDAWARRHTPEIVAYCLDTVACLMLWHLATGELAASAPRCCGCGGVAPAAGRYCYDCAAVAGVLEA